MRDHHGGAPRHQLLQGVLHEPFALGIQGGGGLVQQQHARVLEHSARNGDALLLAAAQLHAALADIGAVPLGQLLDEAGGVGGRRRRRDLLIRGAGAAELDVVGDRHRKQRRLLADKANVLAHPAQGQVAQVAPVERDAAGGDVVEALREPDDGALAAAALADERHHAAGVHAQAEILEDGDVPAGRVGEGHVGEGELAGRGDARRRLVSVGIDAGRAVDDLEDTLHGAARLGGVGEGHLPLAGAHCAHDHGKEDLEHLL
mmetsp:Transcript_39389/g.100639  ORF Transcript_39389/g.100639 Transcript_39389/m.100639 type:complete len:260 (+) Transcript_39389:336-1115(+)